jgi:hypothetical protein
MAGLGGTRSTCAGKLIAQLLENASFPAIDLWLLQALSNLPQELYH